MLLHYIKYVSTKVNTPNKYQLTTHDKVMILITKYSTTHIFSPGYYAQYTTIAP